VTRLLVGEGETVAVGTPIIAVSSGAPSTAGATAGAPAAPAAEAAEPGASAPTDLDAEAAVDTATSDQPVEPGMVGSPAPKADDASTPTLVGYGPRAAGTRRRARRQSDPEGAAAAPSTTPPPAAPVTPRRSGGPTSGAARALAKPPVRKLARDLGVDLSQVSPTGPAGTISRADVEAFAGGAGAEAADTSVAESAEARTPQQLVPASGQRETRIPIKGVRKVTAQAMVASAFTAPHVTEWTSVDVTATVKLVDRLRRDRAFADVKVTPLLLVARAVCLAVKRTPEVNSTWDDAAQEIVLKHYVNLGIAAATPRGLMVPNVKNADTLSGLDLARALGYLVQTARSGKTQPADMSGGTFTITNVGMFGMDGGTPILNPGETGILCMGAIRKQPWVVSKGGKDRIKARDVMTIAMSFDHRIVDGEQGSRFLADVARLLNDPTQALLI
jgi:pyruvate dehydrogenase E2 component (dihydrolipoamide acetyltransferase)